MANKRTKAMTGEELGDKLLNSVREMKTGKSARVTHAASDEANGWQVHAIQEGIRDADAGRLISQDDLTSRWEQRRAAAID